MRDSHLNNHRVVSKVKNIQIIERMPSKRNKVYTVRIQKSDSDMLAVMKIYSGIRKEEKCTREYENLLFLQSHALDVPRVIHREADRLFLQYIPGSTVGELVDSLDTGPWIEKLALWMTTLHKIRNCQGAFLKSDCNLRNFIFYNNKIYGIDFEETSWGDPRTDLADICFFILTNVPSFTPEKKMIMRKFLSVYECYSGQELKEMGAFLWASSRRAWERRGQGRL